ncbi:MAG TPA: response regulator [Candidatus Eisenbacteria bacterium]|nr:response regulator [Candidatus Eisenbacteria bacterium]
MTHVVVVEDDPMNALLFRKLLEKRCGCRVTVTESPAELLALVRGGEVGLVLMDVSLGNSRYQDRAVNGVDLCQVLKSAPDTAGVPVLLATAHAMRGDEEALLAESGADGYISKPIVDHAEFVERIRAAIAEAA